jgi:hypothetical protein
MISESDLDGLKVTKAVCLPTQLIFEYLTVIVELQSVGFQ